MISKSLAVGTIDGVNKTFTTSNDFASGSLMPFVNGMALNREAFVEIGSNAFSLEFAPRPGDVVVAYFKVI